MECITALPVIVEPGGVRGQALRGHAHPVPDEAHVRPHTPAARQHTQLPGKRDPGDDNYLPFPPRQKGCLLTPYLTLNVLAACFSFLFSVFFVIFFKSFVVSLRG